VFGDGAGSAVQDRGDVLVGRLARDGVVPHRQRRPDGLDYCADGRLETVSNATHWVRLGEPDVTDLLLDHLSAGQA